MQWFEHDDDKVTTMARFPALSEVEAYWEGVRGARKIPDRRDIDPRGILGALPNAFVLERVAPGLARFRIAGSQLSDLMGIELRGLPISCLIAPGSREAFGDVLENVLNRPATARLMLAGKSGFGKPSLDAQMMLLPLRSENGEVGQILGCMGTMGEIGRLPRRFELTGSMVRRIRDDETALPLVPEILVTPKDRPRRNHSHSHSDLATMFKATKSPHLFVVTTP